jgi:hypothetical protein
MRTYLVLVLTLFLSVSAFSIEGSLISTGSLGADNALVEIEPKSFESGKLVFTMYVNTHTVSFEFFKLEESTTLYINGKEIKPINVPDLYSHHNEGELVFNVLGQIGTDVKIVITDMAGESSREFIWEELLLPD